MKWRRIEIGLFVLAPLSIIPAHALDQKIARFMIGMDPHIIRIFNFITQFGQGGVVLYPAGTILLMAVLLRSLLPRLKIPLGKILDRAAFIFVTVAAAGLFNDVLKIVFGRVRPRYWLSGDMSGFGFFRYGAKFASFPSGHTATSVAAAVAFSVLFPAYRWLFAGFALLIAISRIIVDAHYLTDVIGGAVVGAASAVIVLDALRKRNLLSLPNTQDLDIEYVRETRV